MKEKSYGSSYEGFYGSYTGYPIAGYRYSSSHPKERVVSNINVPMLIQRIEKLRDENKARQNEYSEGIKGCTRKIATDILEDKIDNYGIEMSCGKIILHPLGATGFDIPDKPPVPLNYDADIEYLALLQEESIPADSVRFSVYFPR